MAFQDSILINLEIFQAYTFSNRINISTLRLCFLSKATKHKAYCEYWIGGRPNDVY